MMTAATLHVALLAIRTGNLSKAEDSLLAILSRDAANADAFQLMGMVRKAQGRASEAQEFLRKSLKSQPNQPHVLNNLANLLVATVPDEAAILYGKALVFQPNYPDASANLAGICLRQEKPQEARAHFLRALSCNPTHVQSLLGLAKLELDAGAYEAAHAWAVRAITETPKNFRANTLMGLILAAQNEFNAAVEAYRQALSIGPETAELWAALGSSLRYGLRDQEAFEAFAHALQLDPGNVLAHRNLNSLLWNYGRTDKYLDSYRTMLPLVPGDGVVRIAFAEDLLRHGNIEEAKAVAEEIAGLSAQTLGLSQIRGRIAMASGDLDMATALFEDAILEAPTSSEPHIFKLDSLLKAHKFSEADAVASKIVPLFPNDQDILARLVAARRLSGQCDEEGLWDISKYVKTFDLGAPDGQSVEKFNDQLAQHLRTLHITTTYPVDQTLRGGTQTFGNLLSSDKSEIIQTLKKMLRAAIATYIEELPDDPHHPVTRRARADFDFAGSWSARLMTNGFHTNHIHPQGWLSSAYYVALPDQSNDKNEKAGWFKLGQTNMNLGPNDTPLEYIQPRVGRLILFPSYYWHGTTSFSDAAERLTVAFDVVPK